MATICSITFNGRFSVGFKVGGEFVESSANMWVGLEVTHNKC